MSGRVATRRVASWRKAPPHCSSSHAHNLSSRPSVLGVRRTKDSCVCSELEFRQRLSEIAAREEEEKEKEKEKEKGISLETKKRNGRSS